MHASEPNAGKLACNHAFDQAGWCLRRRSGTRATREEGVVMSTAVLLLDAAWRIDRVIDAEHACELVVMNRVVAASDEIATVMHSLSVTIEIPSVVARIGLLHPCELRPPAYSARRVRLLDAHVCQFVIDGLACRDAVTS